MIENESVFFVGGVELCGWGWGGSGGSGGSGGNKNMNCKGGAEFWERNSEGMGGVRVFFGGCE